MKQSAAIKSLVAHINAKTEKTATRRKAGSKPYPRLRFIAQQEPEQMAAAIDNLNPVMASIQQRLAKMKSALGLTAIPKDAPLRVRIAARRKYAAEFRRIAEENPDQFASMLQGVYTDLKEVVDAVEALAENTDVELDAGLDSDGFAFGDAEEPAEAVEDKVDEVRDEAGE